MKIKINKTTTTAGSKLTPAAKESVKQTALNLRQAPDFTPTRPKKKKRKIIIFLIIFAITGLAVFSSQVIISNQSSTSWLAKLPLIKQIKHLAESADRKLKGEDSDRINILLLGMGGYGHEGAYLTDTIMLASLEPSAKKVALISIPRDLAIPMEDIGWRKINNVNAYAEVETEGSGGLAVSQAISDVLHIPIDYYIRLDFVGFINIINEIGGIEVDVANTLDDYSYPVMGRESAQPYESRFEHLHIDKGWQTMDGQLALQYARSRHASGQEGSDFARTRRQQNIIEAVKNKILSEYIVFRPKIITNLTQEIQDHVKTNLEIWELVKLWDLFKDVTHENIINRVLDNSPNGLLVDMITEEGAYILTPRSGDFAEIQYLINNIFSDVPKELKTIVGAERAAVEVRNGTWINGLATQMAMDIEKLGFTVVRIGNSSRQNFQKSVIYDLTYGEKNDSLTILKNKTKANISLDFPQWLVDDIQRELTDDKNPTQPDFILIIGQDADLTKSGAANPENTNKELEEL